MRAASFFVDGGSAKAPKLAGLGYVLGVFAAAWCMQWLECAHCHGAMTEARRNETKAGSKLAWIDGI